MAWLDLYADTKGSGRCRSCGAPVEWAELASGKRMPFDPPIVPVATKHDEDMRLIETVDTSVTRSHFSTCPEADQWRRRRK